MGVAVAGRELNDAELVAAGNQAQGFGIDGDGSAEIQSGGQVALVKLDGHQRVPPVIRCFRKMVP